jgi:voltage-gated potassium channel
LRRSERSRLRDRQFSFSRPLLTFAGLLIAYYAFPVEVGQSVALTALSLIVTAGGLGLVIYLMTAELRQVRRGQKLIRLQTVALMLVMLVMAASLAFYLLNLVDASQIEGLETRTDALYFTLSTMATVGFGDVHAEGQLARGMVVCLIVFNVVVVATLAREAATHVNDDAESKPDSGPDSAPESELG